METGKKILGFIEIVFTRKFLSRFSSAAHSIDGHGWSHLRVVLGLPSSFTKLYRRAVTFFPKRQGRFDICSSTLIQLVETQNLRDRVTLGSVDDNFLLYKVEPYCHKY